MRRVAHRARIAAEVLAASYASRTVGRRAPAIVCLDLDNTLADTGSLLHAGLPLDVAAARAEPVPNMLAFVATLRSALPQAHHVVLSARRASLRSATAAWLDRNGLGDLDVVLVPTATAKVRIWRGLALRAPLLIVDDLNHAHETGAAVPYPELVRTAQDLAACYLGAGDIAAIAASAAAGAAAVERMTAAVAARPLDARAVVSV